MPLPEFTEHALQRGLGEPSTAQQDELATSQRSGGGRRLARQKIAMSLVAFVIDAIVTLVLASFLLSVLIYSAGFESRFAIFAKDLRNLIETNSWFSLLILGVLYLSATRTFLEQSLGDWACRQQLCPTNSRANSHKRFPSATQANAEPIQHANPAREFSTKLGLAVRHLWRSLLVVGTGFVFLPTVALMLNRDLLADCTGLELTERP